MHLPVRQPAEAARIHYSKAEAVPRGAKPDYENSIKESVAALESVASTLTGEPDFGKAIREAVDVGLIPGLLAQVPIQLHAYRGDAPGVAHDQKHAPNATPEIAQLIHNLAGALCH